MVRRLINNPTLNSCLCKVVCRALVSVPGDLHKPRSSLESASQSSHLTHTPYRDSGDLGSIPGLGRCPGEGNGTPLQYSCLENPMDGESWWATVHGVMKSQTQLSDFTFTFRVSSLIVQGLGVSAPTLKMQGFISGQK